MCPLCRARDLTGGPSDQGRGSRRACARFAEPPDVADRRQERRRADHVDPGDAHQPPDLGRARARSARSPLDPRDLPSRTRSGACNRRWSRAPPSAARAPRATPARRPNRSVTLGASISRRISTAWISFLALRFERQTSCARRASRRRIARVRSSGIQTASSDPAASNRANVRASSRSVFARAWRIPVSRGLTTTTRATCGSRIRAISPRCR